MDPITAWRCQHEPRPGTERNTPVNNQHHMKSQHQEVFRQKTQLMSDQEVTQRYAQELVKLRTLNDFGRHNERFLGYPNTLVMNSCRQELKRRGLPVPPVNPLGETEGGSQNA